MKDIGISSKPVHISISPFNLISKSREIVQKLKYCIFRDSVPKMFSVYLAVQSLHYYAIEWLCIFVECRMIPIHFFLQLERSTFCCCSHILFLKRRAPEEST